MHQKSTVILLGGPICDVVGGDMVICLLFIGRRCFSAGSAMLEAGAWALLETVVRCA